MYPDRIAALPCWQGRPRAEPLSGGLSNEIWKVTDDAGSHVVRLGQDYPVHHVLRAREAMTARAAHRAGFGPEVRYTAPGVMVTEFIAGQAWDGARVRAEAAAVGRLLAEFHRRMPGEVEGAAFLFWPFHVVRDYARTLAAGGSAWRAELPRFLALNAALEATQPPLPIVFGHNDLLPANFLDDGARVWLIDYEYAGFSTAMFDLAGAASNAGMTGDEAAVLLGAYLGQAPDAAFRRAFDAMQVESLLREAMWAMVSQLHLSAPGVDYAAYARENLGKLDAALDRFQTRHRRLP
jgi:thiamine kinase-like enzyme